MPYIVLAQKLAFQPVDPDEPRIPIAPEEIVERGNPVPGYVSTFIVSALANAGQLAWVEDLDPRIVPANQAPAQVRTPDMPPVLPSDPNGRAETIGDPAPPDDEGDDEPEPLPSAGDKKEVWEAYAQRPEIGIAQADAESMTKATLMAAVTEKYNANQAGN